MRWTEMVYRHGLIYFLVKFLTHLQNHFKKLLTRVAISYQYPQIIDKGDQDSMKWLKANGKYKIKDYPLR